jgi:glycosyltransferase involved in cell wall biosynthesis
VPALTLQRIAFAWPELPHYGARLLRAGIAALGVPADVLSTRSQLPIAGVDEVLGQPVRWIEPAGATTSWASLKLPVPEVLVIGGWATPAFNSLAAEARSRGARVILLMDNPWKGTLRQLAGAAWFRLRRQHAYDAIWVPGQAGARFAAALGFPKDRIETGLYAADSELFHGPTPLAQRPRTFLFVGQWIERKGLRILADALRQLGNPPPVTIDAFGSGPLAAELAAVPGLHLKGFLPSSAIAAELNQTRFLVLPSLEDHWPLVVHEATASGCGVITTDGVGSRHELLTGINGWIYPRQSATQLATCLTEAASASPTRLAAIEAESRRLASAYSPAGWARRLYQLLQRLDVTVPTPVLTA